MSTDHNGRPIRSWTLDSYTKGYRGLTRETLQAFKADEKVWIDMQLSLILTRRKSALDMVVVLEKSGLFNKNVGRRALVTTVMEFYNGGSTPGESYIRNEEAWLDEQEKAAHDTAVEQRTTAYRDRAICWLIAKGKRYGEDFTVESAVRMAEQIAYDEEVARSQGPEGSEFWHNFDGNNCDSCIGWDGRSHRCNCGNRRVSWSQSAGHTFENPSIYGEAN